MYLMIQNPGIAPIEAFTKLGLSMSRDNDNAIGQFGSGNKMAVNLLLRRGINFSVYLGNEKLTYSTREGVMDDGLGRKDYDDVLCRLGSRGKLIPCGWTLDYGATDWTSVDMALREFVANALDRTYREFSVHKHDDLSVTMVAPNQVRAKSGTTRIFVEATSEVVSYFADLPSKFLHFRSDPSATLIEKKQVSACNVYHKGVFVRELVESSLFDYNLDNLKLDECRNINDWQAKETIGRWYSEQQSTTLAKVMIAVSLPQNQEMLESKLQSYDLSYQDYREEHRQQWQEAFRLAFGENAVACLNIPQINECVARKGFRPVRMPEPWTSALRDMQCKSWDSVVSVHEKEGREILPPTLDMRTAVDKVWAWVELAGLTNGKDKPQIHGFRSIMDAESKLHGWCDLKGSVYLETCLGGSELLMTALEEVAHHITGATDMSRDFQDFLIRMIVEICT